MLDPLDTLGPLEEEVLHVVWGRGTATAREVHDAQCVGPSRAYTTLMTTLDRLFRKGLLLRVKEGLAWRYRTALTQEEFDRARADALAVRLLRDQHGLGLAALVDAADAASLDRLAGLIAARRRA